MSFRIACQVMDHDYCILVSGVYFVNLQHHTNVQTSVFSNKVTEWTVAFLLCSFFTTVYSTGNLSNPTMLKIMMSNSIYA